MQTPADGGAVIEGFYDWGPGVVLSADCLGRSYQTVLSGRRLMVTMPSFDGTAVVEPPLHYKRPEKWVNVDPPNPWGELRITSTADNGAIVPHTVCVKRVRIMLWINPNEVLDQQLGPQLDEALSPWWEELSTWIEVVSAQDLASLGERRPKQPQTFHLWGGNPDGTMRPLLMMFYATFYPTNIQVLTSDGLFACLSAVARGQTPAPERLHLSDARSLHNDGQWRRAVIDAATAAEVAITSWLDNRLKSADPDVKAALLDTPLTLGRLHRLYTKLGGSLPGNFDQLVVSPRNHAAHRVLALTEEQSAAAIETTSALLDAASPVVL
jgi:hypothetical protein